MTHESIYSCQPGSFAISEGGRVPLAGTKRKARQSIVPPSDAKVVKLEDFSRVIKSKMSRLLSQGGISEDSVEELQIWGTHYQVGLKETADFLSYYSERKVRHNKVGTSDGLVELQYLCVRV